MPANDNGNMPVAEWRELIKESGKKRKDHSPTMGAVLTSTDPEKMLVSKAENYAKWNEFLRWIISYASTFKHCFQQMAEFTWLPAAPANAGEYDYNDTDAGEKRVLRYMFVVIETYLNTSWHTILADYRTNEDGFGMLQELRGHFNNYSTAVMSEWEPVLTKPLPMYSDPSIVLTNFQALLTSYVEMTGGDTSHREFEKVQYLMKKCRVTSYRGFLASNPAIADVTIADLVVSIQNYWVHAIRDDPKWKKMAEGNSDKNKGGKGNRGQQHQQYYRKGGKGKGKGNQNNYYTPWYGKGKGKGGKNGGKSNYGGKGNWNNNGWNNNNNNNNGNGNQNNQENRNNNNNNNVQNANNQADASSSRGNNAGGEQHYQGLRDFQQRLNLED
jgi:hypothetical protein